MADAPTGIKVTRDRDLRGRSREVWVRRALLALLGVVPILGLLNFFGQHVGTSSASSPTATIEVQSPSRLRSGLIYEARIRVIAHHAIGNARLVLDNGWLQGMTLNAVEPSPRSDSDANGALALDLGPMKAGDVADQFLGFQVNPTTVGGRNGSVALYDGRTKLVSVSRAATVFP